MIPAGLFERTKQMIHQDESALRQAMELIEGKRREAGSVIAALEGGAASGKTTLANQIADRLHCPVIPMDDFFLPPALRTETRLAEIGGNIDYLRFNAQVAEPLRKGRPVSYDVYDCHREQMTESRVIAPCQVILVEGVYSLHPLYRDAYNLRLFLRTSPETQDARLRERGEWLYRRFQEVWLPLEKAYFDSENWESCCDAVIET